MKRNKTMKFEESIKEKIDELSAGQKKVGQYILANLEESSYNTLAKISRESGVSETTVIRFAYTLGFESFSAMQNELRRELLGNSFKEEERPDADNVYHQILNHEIEILEKTKKMLNIPQMDLAAKRLQDSDAVLSVANRTTYPAALWFAEILGKYREKVFAVRPEGSDFFSSLLSITSRTAIVAVSFARYSKMTAEFVKLAKSRGAFIIMITDNPLCLSASYGDIVFTTESNRDETGINTISSATAILNVMASAMRRLDSKKASLRLNELEKLYQQTDDVLYE